MNEHTVRAIVRSELRRMLSEPAELLCEPHAPAAGPPSAVEAWVRALPPGTTGSARDWLARYAVDVDAGEGWSAATFSGALRGLCGPGGPIERRRDRTNLFRYTRRGV